MRRSQDQDGGWRIEEGRSRRITTIIGPPCVFRCNPLSSILHSPFLPAVFIRVHPWPTPLPSLYFFAGAITSFTSVPSGGSTVLFVSSLIRFDSLTVSPDWITASGVIGKNMIRLLA